MIRKGWNFVVDFCCGYPCRYSRLSCYWRIKRKSLFTMKSIEKINPRKQQIWNKDVTPARQLTHSINKD